MMHSAQRSQPPANVGRRRAGRIYDPRGRATGSSRAQPRGQILAAVVVITAVLLVAGVATIQLVRTQLHSNAQQVNRQKSFYVADAGIQRGLAELDQDRVTARSSLTYTKTISENFGEGSYTVAISQDPIYPADPSRKRIQSTSQLGGVQSSTIAHVLVQDTDPCAICFSDSGDCRIVTNVGAGTSLFNGLVHSNRDVVFHVLAGGLINASGTVNAVRNITSAGLALLSQTTASAFRGGVFQGPLADTHLLGIKVGVHFNNPANGHGVQQAVAARIFPRPGYDRVRRATNTVLVNDDNPPPFGTWDSTSKTWTYLGTLAFPTTPAVTYYVEGNAHLGTLLLAQSSSATIVARGWIVFDKLDLVVAGLPFGAGIAAGPSGSPAPTVLAVGSGSSQDIHLVGEGEVAIGRPLLSTSPLAFDTDTVGLASALNGIALSGAAVGSTSTRVIAYSETGSTWGKIAAVSALSTAQVSLTAKADATLAYTGSILSNTTCPF